MVKTQSTFLHYPRLDTIMMVEDAIRKSKEYPNKRQLWLSLPRKVMYQTFLVVLAYLEQSHKIMRCRDGSIIWIWNPRLVNKLKMQGLLKNQKDLNT